ncbi:MAG: hypothetical protein MUO91_05515 [candidate division Zixibacteria bacterium]|nr:hypothetical protein [candidate division Zixibacteria bacterium]
MRFRILAQDFTLFNQMYLQVKLIYGHIVSEIPVKPVRLLNKDDSNRRIPLKKSYHLTEVCSPGLLGCLNIDEFLDHLEIILVGIVLEKS